MRVLLHPLGSAGEARQAVPVEDKLAERDDGELPRVLGNPLFGEARLLGGVGGLTHLLILEVENWVLAGMVHADPNAFGERIVAAANFDSDVVANKNGLVEHCVVAYKPGHHGHPEQNSADDGGKQKALAASIELVGEPASGERQE